jgi:hypothetical protein
MTETGGERTAGRGAICEPDAPERGLVRAPAAEAY